MTSDRFLTPHGQPGLLASEEPTWCAIDWLSLPTQP